MLKSVHGMVEAIEVLGSGQDRLYPAKNRDLAAKIAEREVIVTESRPETAPTR